MPWHDRGSMTEKESWSVTAYILKINGIDPGFELNAEFAAQILLSDMSQSIPPTPTAVADPGSTHNFQNENTGRVSLFWTIAIIVTVALILIGVLLLNRRLSQ